MALSHLDAKLLLEIAELQMFPHKQLVCYAAAFQDDLRMIRSVTYLT